MSVAARRLSSALLGAIATWPFMAFGCEEVAVLADDGRYIVLGADNLDELDVGSLRWLNIREVDGFSPNSTFSVSALIVKFFDPESGLILDPRTSDGVILRELGRTLSSTKDLTVLPAGVFDNRSWIDNGRMDRILARESAGATTRMLIIMDREGNEGFRSNRSDATIGSLGIACEDESGRTIIAGLTSRMIVQRNGTSIEPLDQVERLGYRLGGPAMGCVVMAVRVDESAPDRIDLARIDIAANELESEFTTRRYDRRLLFDEGQRMIAHEMEAEQVEGGVRLHPTAAIRVINTDDGRELVEAQMPALGNMSRLLCRGGSERFILSSEKEIHLVDAGTLDVLASRQVPFMRYFVL